jgi:hypothetical protein
LTTSRTRRSRAKSTAAATSAGRCATIAYALGDVVHAPTQPNVCVSATSSPIAHGFAGERKSASHAAERGLGATRRERRHDLDERAADRGVQALPVGVARPAGIAGADALARLRLRGRERRERRGPPSATAPPRSRRAAVAAAHLPFAASLRPSRP